jgi:hypothetical protein
MPEPAAVRGGVAGATAASEPVVLEGLDGGTPLGFLAGLGTQRVLADRAAGAGAAPPGLSWRSLDAWRPVLHGPPSVDAVVGAVHDDATTWKDAPILTFRYFKVEKKGARPVGGLRAPVAVLRSWLTRMRAASDEVSLAYASALMCETATEVIDEPAAPEQLAEDGIEADPGAPLDRSALPTFFDFTSRNAQFLEQVEEIRAHLGYDAIKAGLTTGEGDPTARRSMDWDPGADTPGAIYTGYSRGFLPVAEWLAFRGLVCLPVTGVGGQLTTTGCMGRRKNGTFVWPLWRDPVGPETVRSLVAWPRLDGLDGARRRALGIATVLAADLTKKADGYAGMFSPTRPV